MANEVKKANREAIRKAIQARKEARKTETAAKYAKMRECAKAPAKFAGVLNVLVAKSARQADYMDGLRENLGLVKAAAEAPAKVRVAAARNYGKDFIKIADEQPDMLADALKEAYKGLDEQAAAMEIAAEALGIDLGATPTEKAFADEGKKELGEGEPKGEESEEVPDFESKEEPAEKEEKPAEEKEPEEEKEAASGSDAFVTDRGNDGKPEAPKEAAVGQDAFVSDRDGSGQPKAPQKADIPQAQGKAAKVTEAKHCPDCKYPGNTVEPETGKCRHCKKKVMEPFDKKDASVKKTAMERRDYIKLADAISSSSLSDLDKEAFATHLSKTLKADNPRFDQSIFVNYTMGRSGNRGGELKPAPKPRPRKEPTQSVLAPK